jgi:FkbM family methyltransferase
MKYFSQIGQDQYYIDNIAKHKKNGVFLDVGANNGIFESNTAALEFDYNWTGICIEANPSLINDLKKNRPKSNVINCAVWDENTFIDFEIPESNYKGIQGDLLSRISNLERNNNYFKKHFNDSKKIIKIEAKTITEIIKSFYNLPITIDYMSLDIEGAELEALKSIDFNLVNIQFMTVEHGDRKGYIDQFYNHLKKYGYKIHRINQWDVEFIK